MIHLSGDRYRSGKRLPALMAVVFVVTCLPVDLPGGVCDGRITEVHGGAHADGTAPNLMALADVLVKAGAGGVSEAAQPAALLGGADDRSGSDAAPPAGLLGAPGAEGAAPTTHAGVERDLLAPVRERLELRRDAAGAGEDLEHAELFLLSGDPEHAWEIIKSSPGEGASYLSLRARAALVLHDFDSARSSLDELLSTSPSLDETHSLQIRWFLASDGLEGLERYCAAIIQTDPTNTAALLGNGWLHLKLLDYERARGWFETALRFASGSGDSVRAFEGIADVLYEEQQFDSSLVYLEKALPLDAADDRLLESLALTLIRLGRVGEAIETAELAVEINPFNERAQYTLGNGYSRMNYVELEDAYPEAFPQPSEALLLTEMDSLMAGGARDEARERLLELTRTHPKLTDTYVRLGSLAFEDGDLDAALSHFRAGLRACPGNGRARNGIAKALEAKRLRIDVHRADYERRFTQVLWPDVPGIEEFVLNWDYLSDRHKKQVAISIAPWNQFVPVLIASGSTYYIKPLYQRLSDCPGLETLKDQRINYDSRLWDDVRGCGGYNTVTGIEDVERTVLNRYNTVLHELTHQVHGVLTTNESNTIQDLYREAKEREIAGEKVFISRYQGSSVWEYLAEGANSLMTPRRDDYDTKQIVRERLEELDPELAELVTQLMAVEDMEPYYAVGFANSGYDKLDKNQVDEAVDQFEKALESDASSPEGQAGLVYALSVKGDHGSSCDLAARALEEHPKNGAILLEATRALYHRDGDIRDRTAKLEGGRERVEERERYLVDQELAGAYLVAGDLSSAIENFGRVLDYQEDNPEALWGMGISTALAGDMDAARRYFDKAVRRRSGLVDLRTDYAMILLDAGDLEGAGTQLAEAKLLGPEDSGVAAVEGRMALLKGELPQAISLFERSIGLDPDYDLARILLAEAKLKSGNAQGAWEELQFSLERVENGLPPEYRYKEDKYTFEVVHEFAGYDRRLLYGVASETARALGREEDAGRFGRLSEDALRMSD